MQQTAAGRHSIKEVEGGIVGNMDGRTIDGDALACKVGIGAEEIRLMGTVIAVRAMEFTQMIVMVKLIIHRMETTRTDLAIIGAADTVIGGALGAIHSKIYGMIVPGKILTDWLIGIQDQRHIWALGNRLSNLFKYQIRVAVTHHLIPQEVKHKVIIHGNLREDKAGPALIYLQHYIVGTNNTAQCTSGKQSGSYAGGQIRALRVIDNGKAVFAQHMGNEIGCGSFSIGAGNTNNSAGKAQFFHDMGMQTQSNTPGKIGAAAQQ